MSKIAELKLVSKDISILYIEDEQNIRDGVASFLQKIFDNVFTATDGEEGLEQFKKHHPDIVITDILMPKMNGIEMLRDIKELSPTQHVIVTSAYTESEFFLDSIKLGVSSYLIKPIDYNQMIEILYTTASRIKQEREIVEYRTNLEKLVEIKVNENQVLEHARIEDYEKILLALVKMIEQRDSYTAGHSQRVATYSSMIAKDMGFDEEVCALIYKAGILHDIGKIATPDAILLKPDKLNSIEYQLIKEHVHVGVDILKDIPMFKELIEIINSHHERCDGLGYPQGLLGDKIPPLARIMIVADAFDAMTTNRIYRHKKNVPEAINELIKLSGKQFNPEVVQSAQRVLTHIEIDNIISQQPSSALEEERFVYFYRDSVTNLHNQKYLSVILLKNDYSHFYKHLHIISLHNFSRYNAEFGWDAGDKLLLDFATMLKESFPEALIFRIHANDFVLLSNELLVFDKPIADLFKTILKNDLPYGLHHLAIEDEEMNTMEKLEHFMHRNQIE